MNNGYMPPRGKFRGAQRYRGDYGGYDQGDYGGGYQQQPAQQMPSQADYNNESDMMRRGKYKDSTGWHSTNMGEGDQNVTNLTDTTQGLGSALGKTLGAGVNAAYTGVKKVAKGVGGFFKKLFTGKNPFK